MQRNAELIPEDNLMEFVTGRDGEYNLCHFWCNFELGDLRFFRSQVCTSSCMISTPVALQAAHFILIKQSHQAV